MREHGRAHVSAFQRTASTRTEAITRMAQRSYRPALMGRDMAVDLGTANSLVFCKGRGIVVSEPSIVAVNQKTGRVEAVGREAKDMLGIW